jgi:hypothetical protein
MSLAFKLEESGQEYVLQRDTLLVTGSRFAVLNAPADAFTATGQACGSGCRKTQTTAASGATTITYEWDTRQNSVGNEINAPADARELVVYFNIPRPAGPNAIRRLQAADNTSSCIRSSCFVQDGTGNSGRTITGRPNLPLYLVFRDQVIAVPPS